MNGVTDVRYRVVSMLPGMRIIRLFYRMESPFITPAMARDWVAMIFLSLATTRIPTLILFRKCGYAVQLAVQRLYVRHR